MFRRIILIVGFFLVSSLAISQDLDPRAYMRLPLKTTTVFTGFAFSHGGVVTDPTLPIKNIEANVQASSIGVSRIFNFFGLSSQALVVVPYSWAQVSGEVFQKDSSITRSGMADMRLRYTVLLHGAPAGNLEEVIKAPRKTIIGASINVVAPTGQFFSDKLINLGTNRWSFRPELAISQPIKERWLLDFYAGVWLFGDNKTFFPGDVLRSQEPMGSFQFHLSYNITPIFWIAFDSTYYLGGTSSFDGNYNDDRQDNTRIGITAVVPTGKFSSLKFAASTGAVVRVGQDFNTYSIGWQKTWLSDLKPKK
jgi:Putative MetA-pathway of phenol degradation